MQLVVAVQVEAAVALGLGRHHELSVDVGVAECLLRNGVIGTLLRRRSDERVLLPTLVDRAARHARKSGFRRGGGGANEHDRSRGRRHRQRLLHRGERGLAIGLWGYLAEGRAVGMVGEPLPVVVEQVVAAE
jgi:hypothetical protein